MYNHSCCSQCLNRFRETALQTEIALRWHRTVFSCDRHNGSVSGLITEADLQGQRGRQYEVVYCVLSCHPMRWNGLWGIAGHRVRGQRSTVNGPRFLS
eukprot:4142050-Pyramimonas_sp.AAC.2